MAKFYLTTVEPACDDAQRDTIAVLAKQMTGLAEKCRDHEVVGDPAEADVVLLNTGFTLHFSHVDHARLSVRRHPLRAKYPEKCFVFDPDDEPSPFVPGVFASLDDRHWNASMHRAGPYVHNLVNPLIEWQRPVRDAKYLFSFVGAPSTHSVRERVVKIESPRGLIIATNARWPKDRAVRDAFKQQYADSIHDSKFVLCPRGRGTSSARLFETMRAGRVPVIIADHWVAPLGPDWDSYSVRVAEKDIERIPALLSELEPRAERMAEAARQTFDEWFCEERVFGRIVDWCLEVKMHRRGDGGWRRVRLARQLCRPSALKRFVIAPLADRVRCRPVG